MWLDIIFWFGVILIFIYEIVSVDKNKGETISEITWRLVTTRPIIPLVVGILVGHLFWQSTAVYLGYCK